MNITFEQLPSGVILLKLRGRMDITGAMQIDVQFSAVAAASRAVVVDLGEVEFLASMGLRTLIMGAKAMHKKSGRMILYRPTPIVEEVLVTSGTGAMIPILHDFAQAEAQALA